MSDTPIEDLTPAAIREVATYLRERYPPDGAYPVEIFMSKRVAARIGELLDELAGIREDRMRPTSDGGWGEK